MGVQDRSQGRLFSRPSKLAISAVSGFHDRRSDLCFSVSPVRSCSSSVGLHKDYQTCEGFPTQGGSQDLLLSGRLPSLGRVSRGVKQDLSISSGSLQKTRFFNKQREVNNDSKAESRVFRGTFPSKVSAASSASGESCKGVSSVQGDVSEVSRLQETIRESTRGPELCLVPGPSGEVALITTNTLDEPEHIHRDKRQVSGSRSNLQGGPGDLAEREVSEYPSSYVCSDSISSANDRRFESRLGGALLPHRVSGVWPQECQFCSTNQLEMLAIFHSLEHFRSTLQGNPVLIMSDNTTAVSCIRNQGTLRSLPLLEISRKLLEFCEEFSIIPVPKHLPGRLNVLADQESRLDPISTEWSLDPETFRGIWNRHGPFACDLFANRFNTQLENFLSPFPDPLAQGTNALSIAWDQWDTIYLFPPVPLLHEVVARLSSYQGRGVLIAPLFPASAWFPNLLLRSKEHSRLPPSMSLSQETTRGRVFHPNPSILRLQEWKL